MPLNIIGIGMPRTGTASLCEALRILGYNAIHHAPERIDLDTVNADSFAGLYDDVDAVVDMPAAYFYREIERAYPGVKFILTTRFVDEWWESIRDHVNWIRQNTTQADLDRADRLHAMIFGSAEPQEFIWKRRFVQWERRIAPMVIARPRRASWLSLACLKKWGSLCEFLDKPIPDTPYPHEHKGKARYS